MAEVRHRPTNGTGPPDETHDMEMGSSTGAPNGEKADPPAHHHTGLHMPHIHKKTRLPRGINPAGETGRTGVHPFLFLKACFRSSSLISKFVNILWPFVPVAIALHFARPDLHKYIFAFNYIAMVPTANLIGYAGQELARKLPKVFGRHNSRKSGRSGSTDRLQVSY